ncbi:MAG: SDR family oxidoreductase [Acidobacteriota bacterium]
MSTTSSTVFFTGFPGFLGARLLPRVLQREEGDQTRAVCLVQSKFAALARQKVAELEGENPALEGRIELVEGDITQPDLGLDNEGELASRVTEIFHLAAIYDLSIPRPPAYKVNVEGTRYVLDFAERCANLERVQYVSTCYISGRYAGAFRETDLAKGQTFNNFYEETKYLAEVEVQKRMERGLPCTVYRPAVVVGDSRTGETQKFDGPYFVMRWLLRQPLVAVLPVVGDPQTTRVNLVPSDFIVEAIDSLSKRPETSGRVYQLCDPNPATVDELLDIMARACRRKVVRAPLPKFAAKAAIDYVPFVYRVMQIPSSAIDYFVHPTYYTCDNTLEDLADTGIAVPPFASYVERLVAFVKGHPEVSSKAMR